MRRLLGPTLLCLSALSQAATIHFDLPVGGWRSSAGERVKYEQRVNYPASSVRVPEDQSQAGIIRGTVEPNTAGKSSDPFLLIVNGISMPMRVDNGRFERPYSFGAGSNSVEVRSPDRTSRARVQFYETYAGASQPDLRVVLSWDSDGTDLDLHVITPDGQHCYYGNRTLRNGSALDVDVTTGYGPEIFSSPAPVPGTYLVYVNYFGSGKMDDLTVAKVTVISHESTSDEKQETVTVPMRAPGDLTLVHSFVYP